MCSKFPTWYILHAAHAHIRWPIHGNLRVTLMLVFLGGLRQNFDNTLTTWFTRTQNSPKHPLGAAKRPPRAILLCLGSHQTGFVKVVSIVCQSFVEGLPNRQALKWHVESHALCYYSKHYAGSGYFQDLATLTPKPRHNDMCHACDHAFLYYISRLV